MKQRLIKVIFCITLSISVFLCAYGTAFADDSVASNSNLYPDEIVGDVLVESVSEEFDLSLLSDLEEDDYNGSAVFQVLSQKTQVLFSRRGDSNGTYVYEYSFVLPVYLTIGFQVERGHTYSGAVNVKGSTSFNYSEGNQPQGQVVSTGSFGFSGYDEVSPESIDVSVYPVIVDSSGKDCDYTVNINFNNYQSTYDGYVYVNLTLDFYVTTVVTNVSYGNWIGLTYASVSTHSTDWAGTLKDYATDAIVDSDGSLIKNQTIQQQQIANQQAQQSQQQHQDLVSGYDNAANDNMLADKNSVLQGFEQQQDQAISGGQQYVADFSANYDTAPLQAMAPAFMMISTWFNDLWGGMGNFSTVLIVGLMLCVAGYILKLKH